MKFCHSKLPAHLWQNFATKFLATTLLVLIATETCRGQQAAITNSLQKAPPSIRSMAKFAKHESLPIFGGGFLDRKQMVDSVPVIKDSIGKETTGRSIDLNQLLKIQRISSPIFSDEARNLFDELFHAKEHGSLGSELQNQQRSHTELLSASSQSIRRVEMPPSQFFPYAPATAATNQQLAAAESEQPNWSPEQLQRKADLHRCLATYFTRHVDSSYLRPWSIMHGLIAYGDETLIFANGKRVNAATYLCENGIGDDRRILYVDRGQLNARVGRGVQGHEGQLLAMFAQSNIAIDTPMFVEGQSFTIRDLVAYEQRTCRVGTELTFKLIGLSHYLSSNTSWQNELGEGWTIPKLIEEELKQPVKDVAACGGTHRLMGLSYAVKQRNIEGKPLHGQWSRADQFLKEYQAFALHFQNTDGSFSTNWFRSREDNRDARKRLYTTGHIIEWLVFSLPEERLDDPQILNGIDFLTRTMLAAPNYELEVGPKGHALHALRMYEERRFEKSDHQSLMSDEALVRLPQNVRSSTNVPAQPANWNSQTQSHPQNQLQPGNTPRRRGLLRGRR